MNLSTLNAVSPIDGRYRHLIEPLADFFSEGALIQYRVRVEVEYFIALCKLPLPQLSSVDAGHFDVLRKLCLDFSSGDAEEIKSIEKITNHDVKAVEYFLKNRFDALGLTAFKEFIHFGLTSQDINNTAVPLSLKEGWIQTIRPAIQEIIEILSEKARAWKDVPMLARTHGQPASPTRLGKEIYVFVDRLVQQMNLIETIPFAAKFGGATGNFNAHHIAYPQIDWNQFADRFVGDVLGLHRSRTTTQIEHYDHLAAFFDNLKRIDTILIDMNRDMWTYISMNYFRQAIQAREVGSSAMPHKVNPIDFENSEGNLGIANAVFGHLSEKLPVSRLQRDLTDSTVLRNIGVPLSHMLISLKSLKKGLGKLILNETVILRDLEENWAVVAEAVQTVLRREGYPEPYEALKALTRTHARIDQKALCEFINGLSISDAVKQELKKITPDSYTGICSF
ncbi:MAG: adenylosuccinate lyase [Desulfobacterales bacterium]|jgi:adenylosuccinate lyase|nr:adenylosuccinate lyase [Desulfobacterales bacterium]MDY0378280.1 adenylosuccinate lyase [Desulfobacterales bacterium]